MKTCFEALALCALGLAACLVWGCGDDAAEGDGGTDTDTDADSDTGIDTEGHEFAIDGGCDPESLVGAFEVASRDTGSFQYAVVGGAIADGVNWNTTALLRQDVGACKLYEFSMWSCSPACQGGEICNDESECVPFPTNLDWGTAYVDGLVKWVEMEPDPSFNYQYQDIDNPPFTAGERIVLWAEGGEGTSEIFMDGMGVTPLEVETKDYLMQDSTDMEVTWIPSDDTEGEIYGQFMIDQHGASKMWIFCSWDDSAGSGIVPANLVHELYVDLLEAPLLGFATAYLFRRTVDSVQVPQGCAEFRVLSQIQLNLDYVPPGDGGVD
jgi:hypothetical protein